MQRKIPYYEQDSAKCKAQDYIMSVLERQLRWFDLDTLHRGYISTHKGPNMLNLHEFEAVYNYLKDQLFSHDENGEPKDAN